MSKYLLKNEFGKELGKFRSLESAHEFAEDNNLSDEPYEIHDLETGVVTMSLIFPIDELQSIKAAAKLEGLTIEAFINKALASFLEEEKAALERSKVEAGQIWKYKDSETLYMVTTLDIASCLYTCTVNLTNGFIGPIWEDEKAMVKDMEFVALKLDDILIPAINLED